MLQINIMDPFLFPFFNNLIVFCCCSWLAKECSQLCFTLKPEPNFILFNHHHTTCYIYAKPKKKKKSLKIFLGMIDKFCCNFYCNTNQLDQTHVSGLLEVNILAAFRLTKLTILIHYLWCVFVEPMLRIWIKVAWWVSVSMYCSDCQADDLKNKWESWVPLKLKESSLLLI